MPNKEEWIKAEMVEVKRLLRCSDEEARKRLLDEYKETQHKLDQKDYQIPQEYIVKPIDTGNQYE